MRVWPSHSSRAAVVRSSSGPSRLCVADFVWDDSPAPEPTVTDKPRFMVRGGDERCGSVFRALFQSFHSGSSRSDRRRAASGSSLKAELSLSRSLSKLNCCWSAAVATENRLGLMMEQMA